ncbi:MAG: hypothetical protein AAFQ87_21350, partial [Bacteroidota bacterium]
MEGIGDLTKNTPFKTIITQLQNLDAGSLIISVEGSVASGVEANKSIGIAISLEALDHMATNQGALTGFDGPIMSFISTAGIAIFSAGGGGDIVIGYDVGKPDDVDGFGIDVSLSLKAKAGGSVSVGLDPISSFPPDLTSVAVGVGGGASIEASVGASYTTVIALYYPSGFQFRAPADSDRSTVTTPTRQLKALPSAAYIQKTSHPKRFWFRYRWDQLPATAQKQWTTLGWDGTADAAEGDGTERSGDQANTRKLPLASFQSKWASLTEEQKTAATKLGFTQPTWDKSTPSGAYIRSKTARSASGFKSSVDEYWDGFTWSALAREENRMWRILGFNKDNFEERKNITKEGKIPAIKYRQWAELSVRQQKAAAYLGYSPSTWIAISPKHHAQLINFALPGNPDVKDYDYFSTPTNIFAKIKSTGKVYILQETVQNNSRWIAETSTLTKGQGDGNSFSFEVKDIKSLSVYHTGESTPFRKVYGLKITTHSGSLDFGKFSNNPVQRIDTLELSDSNYLTKVALQHISAAEKNTRSYTDSSLPTNIAYLKIETNQDDKIEAGKIRTNAFSAIVLSTADEVQTVSGRFSKIYGRYGSATKANNGQDDVYLKKISFDYTLGRFNPDEPQFRHSGRVHSFDKHFLETKIAKIALYQGDEFGLHTLVINENVYGSTS